MSEPVIEARGLTKTYRDGITAVKDLDLVVSRGAVYGLIGRNGSGKTTALRLILGLLRPDRGAANILGWDFWQAPRQVRQRVAYVSQTQRLPGGMTLEDLCRCLKQFNQKWDQDHALALARLWNLPWKRPVDRLSNGEQCRAALLLAFAGRPEVLVLDEPAAGFDPVARRDLINQILDAITQSDGCTVLLSTHVIGDLERVADHIGIIDRGRLALSAPLENLLNQTKRVQLIFGTETLSARFTMPGALRVRREGVVLNALVRWGNGTEPDMLRASTDARIQVFPVSLEEIFMELFGNEPAPGIEPQTAPFRYAPS
jgi:ABC-2 type transport system ATP-binding protein